MCQCLCPPTQRKSESQLEPTVWTWRCSEFPIVASTGSNLHFTQAPNLKGEQWNQWMLGLNVTKLRSGMNTAIRRSWKEFEGREAINPLRVSDSAYVRAMTSSLAYLVVNNNDNETVRVSDLRIAIKEKKAWETRPVPARIPVGPSVWKASVHYNRDRVLKRSI